MKPMKLTDVGTDVEPYITDPNWIMQQKHDGARMLVVWDGTSILFTNDGVKPIAFSAAKLKLPALEEQLRSWFAALGIDRAVFDGELIIETGVYHVFDVLDPAGDNPAWDARHLSLRALFILPLWDSSQLTLVVPAVTAWDEEEKRALWARINELGVEGAVSKRIDSLYVPGTRTKEWVKHKLVKTADVVVTHVDRTFDHKGMVTHGSADLAVPIAQHDDPEPFINAKGRRSGPATDDPYLPFYERGPKGFEFDPRTLLPIGSASLIGKDLSIAEGAVVEIRYLYWTGQACIQPAILRKRLDKTAAECDLAQFPEYTREVVTIEGHRVLEDVSALQREVIKEVLDRAEEVGTAPSRENPISDGHRTGRGPSGKLRNFDAMGDAKFQAEAAKIEAENNDPEALEAIRASRASRVEAL